MTDAYRLLKPRPMAARRLILFPFAGAGAHSFRAMLPFLPQDCEPWALQLPGREDRLGVPPLTVWEEAMSEAAPGLLTLAATHPVILYGHSLGALMALHMTGRLLQSGHPAARVVIGAPPICRQHDDETAGDPTARLEAIYGPLPASFSAPEILEAALPALRADLALLHGATPSGQQPDLLLLGRQDPSAGESAGAFPGVPVQEIEGGHYFVISHPEDVMRAIFPD